MAATDAQSPLESQYSDRIDADLAENEKERDRIAADIASLQTQLATLEKNRGLLERMRQTLAETAQGSPQDSAQAKPAQQKTARIPRPASRGSKKQSAPSAKKKSAAAPKKRSAGATKKPRQGPTLVDVIATDLATSGTPRSASEITAGLTKSHPEHTFNAKVVRNTLEALVAKGQAERTRQKRSVFYTRPAAATAPASSDSSE